MQIHRAMGANLRYGIGPVEWGTGWAGKWSRAAWIMFEEALSIVSACCIFVRRQ